jgi:hypothetical protein
MQPNDITNLPCSQNLVLNLGKMDYWVLPQLMFHIEGDKLGHFRDPQKRNGTKMLLLSDSVRASWLLLQIDPHPHGGKVYVNHLSS